MKSGEVTVAGNAPDAIQVNGLLASEFGQDSGPFAEHMASASVERYAKKFLGEQLRLGFVGLWVSDAGSAYDSTWHRDTSGVLGTNHREDVDETRELDILKASRGYAGSLLEGGGVVPSLGGPRRLPTGAAGEYLGKTFKWQMALQEEGDPCLFVCPGTHQRYRTEEERQALCYEWETDGQGGRAAKRLATEVQLKLKRGQAAVWAGSLIHRGRKPPDHPVPTAPHAVNVHAPLCVSVCLCVQFMLCAVCCPEQVRMSLIGNIARADLDIPPEAPKEFLMDWRVRESWSSLPRGEVLQRYYDNWLAVHAGAAGWPSSPKL